MQVQQKQLELDMEQRLVPNCEVVHQGCILSPSLFNLYAEYIMGNARLDEANQDCQEKYQSPQIF